jgi:hypothetical protein
MSRASIRTSVVLSLLCWAAPAAADVVVDWNAIALQAVSQAGPARPGPSGMIDMAMVQLAVHDALQAFEGRWESYGGPIANASGSPVAAAAAAARGVLIGCGLTMTATGSVDSRYQTYLADRGLTADPGVQVGQQAADNILALRANNDGRIPPNPLQFFGDTGAGEWRSTSFSTATPPQPLPMVAAYLSGLLPFTLRDPSQFRQEPPPHIRSGKYADEYDEVKQLGSLRGSERTEEQTDAALFFADNAVAYWNRAFAYIADQYFATDSGAAARMFALTNMAMADSLITVWYGKIYFNFWRPMTAIRLGDSDGNSRTVGDPTWVPFIGTPNYPDYPSGANGLSGAATTMLANIFKTDRVPFQMTSVFVHPTTDARPTSPRMYGRFSEAADDIVNARIWEGIHFRSADEDARAQAKHVADWAFSHYLRPVH